MIFWFIKANSSSLPWKTSFHIKFKISELICFSLICNVSKSISLVDYFSSHSSCYFFCRTLKVHMKKAGIGNTDWYFFSKASLSWCLWGKWRNSRCAQIYNTQPQHSVFFWVQVTIAILARSGNLLFSPTGNLLNLHSSRTGPTKRYKMSSPGTVRGWCF